MKKTAYTLIFAASLLIATAATASAENFFSAIGRAIPYGIGLGIGNDIYRTFVPNSGYGYGGRPGWLNGPFCSNGMPPHPYYGCGGGYSSYGQTQVIERVIVVEPAPQQTASAPPSEPKPSVTINNVNSGNTINNFYGDKATATAIKAASTTQDPPPRAKKIKKAKRAKGVIHPTSSYY